MPRHILISSSDKDVARVGRKLGSGDSTRRVSVVNLLSGRQEKSSKGRMPHCEWQKITVTAQA